MTNETLDERIAAFNEQSAALYKLKQPLIKDVANSIYDRLIELFEARDDEDRKKWPAFDAWLSAHIEYDQYSVYVLTDRDPELKRLTGMLDDVDRSVGRPTASQLINDRLKAAGYTVGLNHELVDLEDLRENPLERYRNQTTQNDGNGFPPAED